MVTEIEKFTEAIFVTVIFTEPYLEACGRSGGIYHDFPQLVSYTRFVELQQRVLLALVLTCRLGKCTGISFVDSTTLDVCHIKREHNKGIFDGIAAKGKSTMGRFYGFKLHLIINDRGEIPSFVITQIMWMIDYL